MWSQPPPLKMGTWQFGHGFEESCIVCSDKSSSCLIEGAISSKYCLQVLLGCKSPWSEHQQCEHKAQVMVVVVPGAMFKCSQLVHSFKDGSLFNCRNFWYFLYMFGEVKR
jgi:hypothetical protein